MKCPMKNQPLRRQNKQPLFLQNCLVLFQEHQILAVESCNILASCPTVNILCFFQTISISFNL